MAITLNGTRFLAHACASGLELRHTTVVGRQGLFAPPVLVGNILRRHGLVPGPADEAFFAGGRTEWADPLFRALGARELEFLDASPYEGATRLHDLNRPVCAAWEESLDTLVDAGSLEHVFDATTAIANYLRMVRVGGSVLLLDMPAVNLCGHGFYQFSPEFFCEVFSARHGFELVSLALAEDWAGAPFYAVARPRTVRSRVELTGRCPAHLFVHARKIASFHGFTQPVVQSDYAEAWDRNASPAAAAPRRSWFEPVRRVWQRCDLEGYWRFTTRRNKQRTLRQTEAGTSRHLVPLEI